MVCLIILICALKTKTRRSRIPSRIIEHRDRVRDEIMRQIVGNDRCRDIIRMGPQAFLSLCTILREQGGLRHTRRATKEEQVAKFLYIVGHNVRNRAMSFFFRRSGETVSRHFHRVLQAVIELEEVYLKQPDGTHVPQEILDNHRFNPYFKINECQDCVGAIDCTHVRVKVPVEHAPRYRGRKEYPTQNVFAACSFDLKFTYVLPGWEGTASDSRIVKSALTREYALKVPQGKYYLADVGFTLKACLITPYRGERYHLQEYSRNPPQNEHPNENLIDEVQREVASGSGFQEGHQTHRENNDDSARGELIRDNSDMEANKKKAREPKAAVVLSWTTAMNEVLIDAYLHQQTLGNKNGNAMTKNAMDIILQELHNHFPDKLNSKEKIKDHMKHLKSKFTSCYDLFKNGLSGFAWDPITSMWIAEPEVWKKLIEARPEAVEWRTKPTLFYDKLAQLFGKDRATGEDAETAAEIRARATRTGITIEDIDNLVFANEASIEGFEADDGVPLEPSPIRPSAARSQVVNSSGPKKNDDINTSDLGKSILEMVEVFKMNTVELNKKQNNTGGEDIWAQLVDIGVEPASLLDVYVHLVKNPDDLKAFNGVPLQMRKELLHRLVPNYYPNY
ncbi:uncharacterized protein LOC130711133 [Lotus japonicus]|uniref:uncharacterized protein LOC130711133 n=1 Tax=Lotus japonicus TaxID=34305 RepID=UPI00258AC5D3|nr:uncharacterized protein LOC130711133 [Lotus japonicus]